MLKTIAASETDLDGKALAVRYRTDHLRPDLLQVSIVAYRTEGEPHDILLSEMTLVAIEETMTGTAMRLRVEAEAARFATDRVAWIREG